MKKKKFDTFGQRLRLMMFERDLSGVTLAEMVGVNQNTISMWLKDRRNPSVATFMMLVEALELTDEEIIDWLKLLRGK